MDAQCLRGRPVEAAEADVLEEPATDARETYRAAAPETARRNGTRGSGALRRPNVKLPVLSLLTVRSSSLPPAAIGIFRGTPSMARQLDQLHLGANRAMLGRKWLGNQGSPSPPCRRKNERTAKTSHPGPKFRNKQ